MMDVLDFYKSCRAYVRGKVESFRLEDSTVDERTEGEALERAKRYFDLSHRYALNF
jgi:uncharacterized protein